MERFFCPLSYGSLNKSQGRPTNCPRSRGNGGSVRLSGCEGLTASRGGAGGWVGHIQDETKVCLTQRSGAPGPSAVFSHPPQERPSSRGLWEHAPIGPNQSICFGYPEAGSSRRGCGDPRVKGPSLQDRTSWHPETPGARVIAKAEARRPGALLQSPASCMNSSPSYCPGVEQAGEIRS